MWYRLHIMKEMNVRAASYPQALEDIALQREVQISKAKLMIAVS